MVDSEHCCVLCVHMFDNCALEKRRERVYIRPHPPAARGTRCEPYSTTARELRQTHKLNTGKTPGGCTHKSLTQTPTIPPNAKHSTAAGPYLRLTNSVYSLSLRLGVVGGAGGIFLAFVT